MNTPTPGDLSARLERVADQISGSNGFLSPDARRSIPAELRSIVAALSALPAGGEPEPVGTVMSVTVDDFGEDLAHIGWHRPVPMVGTKLYTTPPANADVGAQGEEAQKILADAIRLASDGVSFNTPADVADWMREALSAAPAAGKGVDAEELRKLVFLWRIRENNGEELTEFDKGYEQASDEHATHLEAALTRQPVAGDGWRAIVYAALRSIRYNANNGSQDRPPHQRLHLIAAEAERAIACMEASYSAPTGPAQGDGEVAS